MGLGLNVNGEIGDSTTVSKHTPVPVHNLSGIIGMSGGDNHFLMLFGICNHELCYYKDL